MDWAAGGFDWNRARAFLVTAEKGSFSAAARALDSTQPTLGRQVASLEEELGVTLFERVGNQLELTVAGQELVEHVREMNACAERLALTASGQATSIDGVVRLAGSEAVSAFLLPPIVAELRRAHPGIEVEIVASNSSSDLLRREADIAVRNYPPREPELFTTKIKDSHAWLYGTPEYLARIGDPKDVESLCARAEILAFEDADQFIEYLGSRGYPVDRRNFPVRCANHLVQWALTKQGVGLCAMMQEVGDPEPAVVRVLPDLGAPFSFPTWLTTHRELKTSRRIRVVYDFLAEALREALGPEAAKT